MIEDAIDTSYDDITNNVSRIHYNKYLNNPDMWYMTESKDISELHGIVATYTQDDGEKIVGTMIKIQSCVTGSMVLFRLETYSKDRNLQTLTGKLCGGGESGLGVVLDNIVDIQTL